MTNDAPAQASAHSENPTAGETVGRSEIATQQQSTVGTEDENRHVSRSDPSSQRSGGAEDEPAVWIASDDLKEIKRRAHVKGALLIANLWPVGADNRVALYTRPSPSKTTNEDGPPSEEKRTISEIAGQSQPRIGAKRASAILPPDEERDQWKARALAAESALAAERERCAGIAWVQSKQGATHDQIAAAIRAQGE